MAAKKEDRLSGRMSAACKRKGNDKTRGLKDMSTLQPKSHYVFPEKELCGLVPISTFMCMWAIYIFPESVHILSCCIIGRLILAIYKLFNAH
jgi:hypothetical protein